MMQLAAEAVVEEGENRGEMPEKIAQRRAWVLS